jgi:homoserine O-acetyltransferase/O-succinyltransferase
VVKLTGKKDLSGTAGKKYFEINEETSLESGKKLSHITLAYETFGTLDKNKSNAILVFHALSGDSHVSGNHAKPGWWDLLVGPGKGIDTGKYFVICANVLGGCQGSTGPSSINPKTKKPYCMDFPVITINDMVNVQKKLIDFIGIKKLLAVIGGSMGGMQALQWAVNFPDSVKMVIPIATAAKQSAQNIAFHEAGRKAIAGDINWNKGNYYGKENPGLGLSIARMIGHITYLSQDSMREKFGRRLQDKEKLGFSFETEFQVESYLKHQGTQFVERFDANSYLYISKAIDYFDLTDGGTKRLEEIFSKTKAKFLIISFTSDWLYPTSESKEIVRELQKSGHDVIFFEIESNYGHDSFLLKNDTQTDLIRNFLANNHENE